MSTQLSPRVAALVEKARAARGRLIFAIDATGSRERTWDLAASLQAAMFEEAAKIGGLDVMLIHYGGDQVQQSPWLSDAHSLVSRMRTIGCMSGATQIARVLRLIRTENEQGKIGAAVFIGDAVEEPPSALYDLAANLSVALFVFQEGDDGQVEQVFRELARLSRGAYGKFDAGAAKQLGDLLRAVAAFAAGGVAALEKQQTDSARKLLSQFQNR